MCFCSLKANASGQYARTIFLLVVLIFGAGLVALVNGAASGTIYFPDTEVSSADNILHLGESEKVNITFKNSAGADVSDVASTLQYISLSAADVNPSRTIIDLSFDAFWEIYVPASSTPRTSGSIVGSLDTSAIYAPYSTSQTVYLYTWTFGKPGGPSNLDEYTSNVQFTDDLRILRPGEMLNLTVTVKCQDLVGDSIIWFFFRATELQPAMPPTSIDAIAPTDRCNIAYSKSPGPDQTRYWWPLHNSYDPYDEDIGTGHSFEQLSWIRNPTTAAFAKGNKVVHQKPIETSYYSFHICGVKFYDSNRNGLYEIDVESPINDVIITLLGPDQATQAEDYYPGSFIFPAPEDHNPTYTGENNLMGSYCYNIIVLVNGAYTFYVKEELPTGKVNTTSLILGPITLEASPTGIRESLNNNFGNSDPLIQPVGGEWVPFNIAQTSAPWVGWAFATMVITMSFVYIRKKSKQTR